MDIRAKFKLNKITSDDHGKNRVYKKAHFSAVCADGVPENNRYHRYTPSGELLIQIDNQPVVDFLTANIGNEFYFDISVADPAATKKAA